MAAGGRYDSMRVAWDNDGSLSEESSSKTLESTGVQATGKIYWAGAMSTYFLSAVLPGETNNVTVKGLLQKTVYRTAVEEPENLLAPGQEKELTVSYWLGPKDRTQLLAVSDQLAKSIDLGMFSIIAKGLPASPGAATGQIVFFADEAEKWAAEGKQTILVRIETSPEDLKGMNSANGILTARGGMTSHAAVVARGMGKCCVSGAGELQIDYKARTIQVNGFTVKEGDWISLNGSTGEVYLGQVATKAADLSGDFGQLMDLAGKYSVLKVRANADTPKDAAQAFAFGAEGIGLCRTEHMFFEGDRIKAIREMILADDEAGRRVALAKLLPIQRGDFEGLFKAMNGYPVTVRLLDPPLHEFVPHDEKGQKEMAAEMGVPLQKIVAKVESLAEFNPMLGHRGCRLGNTYPEITEMQARAIIEAAMNVKATGIPVHVEIMVPLVGNHKELRYQKNIIDTTAEQVFSERNDKIDYMVGTMIEVPRAAVTANQIAEVAEFFSFGTNDLTQMTLGFSRDDIGKFLPVYLEKGILKNDPFQILDRNGVGQLIREAVFKGRGTRENLKCGICGEHGGEPSSVEFCHYAGLNYVSCSPFRVPIARLAAAHAALNQK